MGYLILKKSVCDEEDGLVCHGRDQNGRIEIPLAEIELKKKEGRTTGVISDYAYWFHNWW